MLAAHAQQGRVAVWPRSSYSPRQVTLRLRVQRCVRYRAAVSKTCQSCATGRHSGRIREYWEQNGGLPVFGFPITPQREERIEGRPLQVQWFERNRLELHPENARPYDVLIGRIGADRLAQQGRDWLSFPKAAPSSADAENCRLFRETGHHVCGEFLQAYRRSGLDLGQPGVMFEESLALFGLPLSEPMTEVLEGREYQVHLPPLRRPPARAGAP